MNICSYVEMIVSSVVPLRSFASRLTNDQVVELADMFRLLGDGSRLHIVLACLDGPHSVGELVAGLGLSQSLVSHHLRLLRAARLLKAERQGKQVHYWIADDHVRRVLVDMLAHVDEPPGGADGEV
jgi:ArsR family transcriptional regulator